MNRAVNDIDTYIIQFDMGRNWSLFFKTYIQYVLEYYNITDYQCDLTDNTVIIQTRICDMQ